MGFLNSKNTYLRPIEPEDIDIIYKWENNTENWRVSNTLVPFSKYVIKQYIENSAHDIYENKQLRFIIIKKDTKNAKDTPIGTIDLFDFEPYHLRAGVGILIADYKYRNKGFADEALKLLINYSFKHLLLHQLYCNIETDNIESLKLFKNNGFIISGNKTQWLKFGNKWKDEYMLQLINSSV